MPGTTLDFKLRAPREKKMQDGAFLIYLQGWIFQKILNCRFISHYSYISMTRETDAYGKKEDVSEPRANLSQPISWLRVHSFPLKLPPPSHASFPWKGHISVWPLLGCWVLILLCTSWTCGLFFCFNIITVESFRGQRDAPWGSSLLQGRKGFSLDVSTFKQETSECPAAPPATSFGTNPCINSHLELFFLLVSTKNFGESTKISWIIQLILLGTYY